MSFTPTAGVPMSAHSGEFDPGLFWYPGRTEGLPAKRFNEMVNFQSGLLGLSETSSDMRDLLDRETQDVRAAEQEMDRRIRSGVGRTGHAGIRWWHRRERDHGPPPDLRWAGLPGNRTRRTAKRGE